MVGDNRVGPKPFSEYTLEEVLESIKAVNDAKTTDLLGCDEDDAEGAVWGADGFALGPVE